MQAKQKEELDIKDIRLEEAELLQKLNVNRENLVKLERGIAEFKEIQRKNENNIKLTPREKEISANPRKNVKFFESKKTAIREQNRKLRRDIAELNKEISNIKAAAAAKMGKNVSLKLKVFLKYKTLIQLNQVIYRYF